MNPLGEGMSNQSSWTSIFCFSVASFTTVLSIVFSLSPEVEAQPTEHFVVRLSVMPVEAVTVPDIAGTGRGFAVLEDSMLSIDGMFSGLRGAATAIRLHEGLGMGIRGTALSELNVVGGVNGTFEGSVELSTDQIESLQRGNFYIQIDSEAAPEGNLWGWLIK